MRNARNFHKESEMKNSSNGIITSQAGSLPRPDDLIDLNRARAAGEAVDEAAYQARLRSAVEEVVRRQVEAGITIPGDGEFGKAMGQRVNYGAWWSYSFQRLGGLELTGAPPRPKQFKAGNISLSTFAGRRDREIFSDAYADPDAGISTTPRTTQGQVVSPAFRQPAATGPVTYTGQAAIEQDIDNFKAALQANGVEEGFMTSIAPGSCARIVNDYYSTEEEFVYACADAMREEYRAIVDAGLILQLDDPAIAENWDMVNPAPSVEDYNKFSMFLIEALNHALRGLPEDRIRFHLCWGSWHGPHTTDIAMKDIVQTMLAVNCQGYSFEAGNVRHEHEWKVWQDVKLPEGKILIPGVVSHATNVIEHPEVVADRIVRFANAAGRENVIAATDCGLGGRVHAQLAWAKLEALAQGAKLATAQLWR
jgi:5-methyltetrahydropteroyltriglutamate--homocysteine methyltransferase